MLWFLFLDLCRLQRESTNYQPPNQNTWNNARTTSKAGLCLVIFIRLIKGTNPNMKGPVHHPNLNAEVVGSLRILGTFPTKRQELIVGNLLQHQKVKTRNFPIQLVAVMLQILVLLWSFDSFCYKIQLQNDSTFYDGFSTWRFRCSSSDVMINWVVAGDFSPSSCNTE